MSYQVNQRDIDFNLFDYLKLHQLVEREPFQGMDQDLFRSVLRESLKFAQNELAPLNRVGDDNPCYLKNGHVVAPPGFKEAYRKFAAQGFLALDVPPTYGGTNLPLTVSIACAEFFTGACLSFLMYAGLGRGVGYLIESLAEPAIAARFAPQIYGGQWGGTMCLTEAQAGTAVGDITTKAIKNGDYYLIEGQKIFISGGDHDLTENIIHTVLARIEGDPPGTKGLSLFLVPKIWVNEDGSLGEPNDVKTINVEKKMGIKGSATCTLLFGDQKTCRGFLLGEPRKGLSLMFNLMNDARLLVGVIGQAIAAAAYESTRHYAQGRIQGKGRPITAYPDVRRMLIMQKTLSEGMRALLLYTSFQKDLAVTLPNETLRARAHNRLDLLVPVCKAYCSDMGFQVTELALQTYGGYGYINDYPVEQYLRDIKVASIYEGTNGIQALDLIGRKLAKNRGQFFRELYEDVSAFCKKHKKDGSFRKEISRLKTALSDLRKVTRKFGRWAMTKNLDMPQLHALSYLYNIGDVMLAWLLLDQAILAENLLKEKPDAGEKHFLEEKILTARFFAHHILPRAKARTDSILDGDDSPLRIQFD